MVLVVAFPRELHESPTVVDLPGGRIRFAVRHPASLALLLYRLHVLIRLVIGGGKSVGEPAVVLGPIFCLPTIQDRINPIDLCLLQVVGEQGSARLSEEKSSIDRRHVGLLFAPVLGPVFS